MEPLSYQEASQFVPGTNLVDDAQILGKAPGKICKLVIFCKTFICGIQIFYDDGTSSGYHGGFMESATPAAVQELIIDPNDNIVLISGYISDYIGALHIRTSLNRTLDIGQYPKGKEFRLGEHGKVIRKLLFGYTGYVNYLGAFLLQLIAAPAIIAPRVECTLSFGLQCPKGTPFDDYTDVVYPALCAGSRVRISRMKVYNCSEGIMGMKVVYEITDAAQKVTKKLQWHRSKKVGLFTSTKSCNFKPGDHVVAIQGKYTENIRMLRITINNEPKIAIECGKDIGSEFLGVPSHNGPIIAFSGTVGEYLYTIRAYAMY